MTQNKKSKHVSDFDIRISDLHKLPKVIYVMGPPGAGKGTQAEMLAQKIGYHRFSTGDAFRAQARQDTPLGRKVDEIIHGQGKLMPPEDAAAVVIAAIKEHVDKGSGLIFDGTPRTVKEAQMVDDFFIENGYGQPLAIYLHVGKKEMIERNTKRRFCLDIDNDFPVVTAEDEQRCQELNGRIGRRPDDEPEKQEMRWSQFEENTKPVIERYLQEGIAVQLRGTGSIEDVHRDVMMLIEKLKNG